MAERSLTFVQAINEALHQAMEHDPTVVVLGEDVAGGGGREAEGISDAWGGIMGSNPFPPLPNEFRGDHLSLRFRFYYNPDKNEME